MVHKIGGKEAPKDKPGILASAKQASSNFTVPFSLEFRVPPTPDHYCCAACDGFKLSSAFARSQLNNKGPGKQRCVNCVAVSLGEEQRAQDHGRLDKLKEARQASRVAECTGPHDVGRVMHLSVCRYSCALRAMFMRCVPMRYP